MKIKENVFFFPARQGKKKNAVCAVYGDGAIDESILEVNILI